MGTAYRCFYYLLVGPAAKVLHFCIFSILLIGPTIILDYPAITALIPAAVILALFSPSRILKRRLPQPLELADFNLESIQYWHK
jgi:hypothetical protein